MNIKQVLPDPDLYRAVLLDDPDMVYKAPQRAKTARRAKLSRLLGKGLLTKIHSP